jgi:hypothetical protein
MCKAGIDVHLPANIVPIVRTPLCVYDFALSTKEFCIATNKHYGLVFIQELFLFLQPRRHRAITGI